MPGRPGSSTSVLGSGSTWCRMTLCLNRKPARFGLAWVCPPRGSGALLPQPQWPTGPLGAVAWARRICPPHRDHRGPARKSMPGLLRENSVRRGAHASCGCWGKGCRGQGTGPARCPASGHAQGHPHFMESRLRGPGTCSGFWSHGGGSSPVSPQSILTSCQAGVLPTRSEGNSLRTPWYCAPKSLGAGLGDLFVLIS